MALRGAAPTPHPRLQMQSSDSRKKKKKSHSPRALLLLEFTNPLPLRSLLPKQSPCPLPHQRRGAKQLTLWSQRDPGRRASSSSPEPPLSPRVSGVFLSNLPERSRLAKSPHSPGALTCSWGPAPLPEKISNPAQHCNCQEAPVCVLGLNTIIIRKHF